ncbi:MAG: hypothetical protein H0U73_03655 [Tatlockia sp.]|nr:hypothetical protein [Tatlockia sp.]
MKEKKETVSKYFEKLLEVITISQKFTKSPIIRANQESIEVLNQKLTDNLSIENLEEIYKEGRSIALDTEKNLLTLMIANLKVLGASDNSELQPHKHDSRIHEVMAHGLSAIEKAITQKMPTAQRQLIARMTLIKKNLEKGSQIIYDLDKFAHLINHYQEKYTKQTPSDEIKATEQAVESALVVTKITSKPRKKSHSQIEINEFTEIKPLAKFKLDLSDLNEEYSKLLKTTRNALQPLIKKRAQPQIFNQVKIIDAVESENPSQYDKLLQGFERAIAPLKKKKIKEQGIIDTNLKAGGFSIGELKDMGFSAGELMQAGFTTADLKVAGFSETELDDALTSPIIKECEQFSQQVEAIEKKRTSNIQELTNTDILSPEIEAEKFNIQKQIQYTQVALKELKAIDSKLTKIKEEKLAKYSSVINSLNEKISELSLTISNIKANKAYSSVAPFDKTIVSLDRSLKRIITTLEEKLNLFSQNPRQESIDTKDLITQLEFIEGHLPDGFKTINNHFLNKVTQLHYEIVTLKARSEHFDTATNAEHLALDSLQQRLKDLKKPDIANDTNYLELDADEIKSIDLGIQKVKQINLLDMHLFILKEYSKSTGVQATEIQNCLEGLQVRLNKLYIDLSSVKLKEEDLTSLENDITKATKFNEMNKGLYALKENRKFIGEANKDALIDLGLLQSRLLELYKDFSTVEPKYIKNFEENFHEAGLQAEKLESNEIKIVSNLLGKIQKEIIRLVENDPDANDARIEILQTIDARIRITNEDYLLGKVDKHMFKQNLIKAIKDEVSEDKLKELTYQAPDVVALGDFGRFLLEIFDAIAAFFVEKKAYRPQLFATKTETNITQAVASAQEELGEIRCVIQETLVNANSVQLKH